MTIKRHAGTMVVAAALLAGACSGGGKDGADAAGGGGGANAGGASGGGGAAGGGTCTPTSCGPTQFCNLTFDTCAGGAGSCAPRPVDCIEPEKRKVCACDGKVYASACEANGSGLDLSAAGGCTPPAGMFPCGSIFCTRGTEYCVQSETLALPWSFYCLPLPSGCGATPTCACVVPNCCSSFTISTSGDLTITCAQL